MPPVGFGQQRKKSGAGPRQPTPVHRSHKLRRDLNPLRGSRSACRSARVLCVPVRGGDGLSKRAGRERRSARGKAEWGGSLSTAGAQCDIRRRAGRVVRTGPREPVRPCHVRRSGLLQGIIEDTGVGQRLALGGGNVSVIIRDSGPPWRDRSLRRPGGGIGRRAWLRAK